MVRCRALGLLLLLAVGSLGGAWLTGPLLLPARPSFLTGLTAFLAWSLLACWTWLALTTALLALETAATGRAARTGRMAPRLLRVVAATVCGVSLTVAVAASGAAEPLADGAAQIALIDGLALPERVSDPPRSAHAPTVVISVRAGDTLWDLADAHGVAWRLLYRANRAVVGPDPDLIRPGMRLVVPTPAPTSQGAQPR